MADFAFDDREAILFEYLVSSMKDMVDITLYGGPDGTNFDQFVPVLLFNKKDIDCETLNDILAEKGFALRSGFHCAPFAHQTLGTFETGGVRLSLGRYNTKREIDKFLNVISTLKYE